MIVIGADPHKQSHTFVAVDEASGRKVCERTVRANAAGRMDALLWARTLGDERVWAIEDCRHVAGRLFRGLVADGERVVPVPPKLMAGARQSARTRGKSDPIDALAVARAAIREGVESLPAAVLEGRALEIRLLLDHRDDLVAVRTVQQGRLRWHLHDLFDDLDIPAGALDRGVWLDRVARKLARADQTAARVRVARALVTSIRAASGRSASSKSRSPRSLSRKRRSSSKRSAAAR